MNGLNDLLTANMLEEINISFYSTMLSMLSAIFSSYLIKIAYVKYGMAMNNRDYFSNSFIILCLTTVAVITIVKYSLALSLGLVGALSIVRFRAAIKEPEELVYLFLVIGLGLAFGSNQFAVGFSLLSISLIVIFILHSFLYKQSTNQNSPSIIIFTGSRQNILDFKENYMANILLKNIIFLKEISIEDIESRLVFNSGLTLEKTEIDKILRVADTYSLQTNIVAQVSVPL